MFRIKCDATKQDIVSRLEESTYIYTNGVQCGVLLPPPLFVVLCAGCSVTSHAIFPYTVWSYRLHTDFFSFRSYFYFLFFPFLLCFNEKLLPFNVSHVSHTNILPHISSLSSITVLPSLEMPTHSSRSLFHFTSFAFHTVLCDPQCLCISECDFGDDCANECVWWCAF